jgi:hypothetical protein
MAGLEHSRTIPLPDLDQAGAPRWRQGNIVRTTIRQRLGHPAVGNEGRLVHAPASSAERKRRYRKRRARGLRVFHVEADEIALGEALIHHGLLCPADTEDPRLVENVLASVIADWVAKA